MSSKGKKKMEEGGKKDDKDEFPTLGAAALTCNQGLGRGTLKASVWGKKSLPVGETPPGKKNSSKESKKALAKLKEGIETLSINDNEGNDNAWTVKTSKVRSKAPTEVPVNGKTGGAFGKPATVNGNSKDNAIAKPGPTKAQTTTPSASVHKPAIAGGSRKTSTSSKGTSGSEDGKRKNRKAGGKSGKGRKEEFISDQTQFCDIVQSRQKEGEVPLSKKGTLGQPVEFSTNYYPLVTLTNFNLFQYHIEYKPSEERTEIRKKLVFLHENTLGSFIFDGQALYSPNRIQTKFLYSENPSTHAKTQISLKLVAEICPDNPVFLQVYNIMLRNMMSDLNLEPMGRFYYDPASRVRIPSRKLEVWPGYITSIRHHESGILLNLEVTHKVVRSDSVLDFINSVKHTSQGDYKREVCKQLLSSIVVTSYNKKNYKVDDIKWDITPKDSFEMKDGSHMTYSDYYKNQYGTTIKDLTQPMLVSLPKKKDYHRGSAQPIFLVPELCQMTGLSDSMRADFKLMKELSEHLAMTPRERVKKGNAFIARCYATPKIVKEFKDWNIEVGRMPLKCMGRIVDLDDLIASPSIGRSGCTQTVMVKQDTDGDWTNIFKNKGMLATVDLKKWILLVPPKNDQIVNQMLISLKTSSRSLNFIIADPLVTYQMTDLRPNSYASIIQTMYAHYKGAIQMFVVVLPNSNAEVYNAIKKKTYCELGVACQCVVVKTLMNKNLATITSRLGIQMNTKLGGVPWSVYMPLKDIMIVGYDVFHSPNRRVASVGALVATTSQTQARYYTSTYFHHNRNELSANLCNQMITALVSYRDMNAGKLPARIVLYRDGVGDGQLSYIYNTELAQIQEAIATVYTKDVYTPAKFSFIIVTKRIHTRIFNPGLAPQLESNPPPGTVIDDVITLPERYDFFLISQQVTGNMGTVSPTSYNVLYDEQGLDPDKMQRLTLKLCHLYYNYTGTIAVPAPCQFAHKLAYLTGTSLTAEAHQKLKNYLYFL